MSSDSVAKPDSLTVTASMIPLVIFSSGSTSEADEERHFGRKSA